MPQINPSTWRFNPVNYSEELFYNIKKISENQQTYKKIRYTIEKEYLECISDDFLHKIDVVGNDTTVHGKFVVDDNTFMLIPHSVSIPMYKSRHKYYNTYHLHLWLKHNDSVNRLGIHEQFNMHKVSKYIHTAAYLNNYKSTIIEMLQKNYFSILGVPATDWSFIPAASNLLNTHIKGTDYVVGFKIDYYSSEPNPRVFNVKKLNMHPKNIRLDRIVKRFTTGDTQASVDYLSSTDDYMSQRLKYRVLGNEPSDVLLDSCIF